MITIKPPHPFYEEIKGKTSVFLAGSIAMGACDDWQSKVTVALAEFKNLVVLNPRRDDWDSSWEQSITNPEFARQVRWELSGIELSDIVFFYFDPSTPAPVTLAEYGIVMSRCVQRAVICCPDGFWRKGNIEVMSDYYAGEPVYNNFDEAVQALIWEARNYVKPTSP